MEIYNKTVKLEFSDSGHKYMVSKLVSKEKNLWTVPSAVVGTTSVTSIINKPFLMLWPMNMALTHLKALKTLPTEQDFREAASAHRAKSDAGKKTGKVGHALVEALLLGKKVLMPTDPDLLKEAESIKAAFESWVEDFKPDMKYTEQIFYSLVHNYCGTCDLVATIDGKLTVVDYKTTNSSRYNPDGIYAENFAQLGAYIIGLEEMLGIKVDDGMIVNLPKNGEEYKVKSLSDMGKSVEDAKMYFLNALGLYEAHKDFGWKLGG